MVAASPVSRMSLIWRGSNHRGPSARYLGDPTGGIMAEVLKLTKTELEVVRVALEMFASHCSQAGSDDNRKRIWTVWQKVKKLERRTPNG